MTRHSYDLLFCQEWGILLGGSLGLLISSGAQTAAPLFFGAVVDAAQKSMGKE